VYTYLAALDPSYEVVRAQVMLSTEKLTFDVVIILIRREATRQIAMDAYDLNPKSAYPFAIQSFNVGKRQG
jgi:hypothetical protein